MHARMEYCCEQNICTMAWCREGSNLETAGERAWLLVQLGPPEEVTREHAGSNSAADVSHCCSRICDPLLLLNTAADSQYGGRILHTNRSMPWPQCEAQVRSRERFRRSYFPAQNPLYSGISKQIHRAA